MCDLGRDRHELVSLAGWELGLQKTAANHLHNLLLTRADIRPCDRGNYPQLVGTFPYLWKRKHCSNIWFTSSPNILILSTKEPCIRAYTFYPLPLFLLNLYDFSNFLAFKKIAFLAVVFSVGIVRESYKPLRSTASSLLLY